MDAHKTPRYLHDPQALCAEVAAGRVSVDDFLRQRAAWCGQVSYAYAFSLRSHGTVPASLAWSSNVSASGSDDSAAAAAAAAADHETSPVVDKTYDDELWHNWE